MKHSQKTVANGSPHACSRAEVVEVGRGLRVIGADFLEELWERHTMDV